MEEIKLVKQISFLLLLSIVSATILAADKPPQRIQYNPIIRQSINYTLTPGLFEQSGNWLKDANTPLSSLGLNTSAASPGAQIGDTYWEYQANFYQGRMIRTGRNFDAGLSDSLTLIHFSYMDVTNLGLTESHPAYAYYDASAGAYEPGILIEFLPQQSFFVNLEVSNKNQAIIAAHSTTTGYWENFTPTAWYDNAPGDGGFSMIARVDSALWKWENPYNGYYRNTIWPHIAFQQRPTGEHITHLTGLCYNGGWNKLCLYYFRKEGNLADLSAGELSNCPSLSVTGWDCPWVVDTPHATVGGVEASKQSGKVALFWTANLPDYAATPGCDTCSVNASLGIVRDWHENDIYYQASYDYGLTWNQMQNVTHMNTSTADWMPYNDIDGLWDKDDKFHIVWNATDWKAYRQRGFVGFGARVYHWTEDFGNAITDSNARTSRVVLERKNDPIACNGGNFNANLAKINIAQCNNNFYVTAVDLWDGHTDPNAADCSERAESGSYRGAVNGEIVVSISDDNGVGWSKPYNLTNTSTPHCDSVGGQDGPCASEHFPSMTPHGIATLAQDDFSGTVKINPRPSQSYPDITGAQWLDIQYVEDLDPGSWPHDNSQIRDNPVRHFRMACVDPDHIPLPVYSINKIGWPIFVKPGQLKDVEVIIENIGNAPTAMSVSTQENSGPAGWLSVNQFAGVLQDGFSNKDTGYVQLNAVGLTNGAAVSGYVLFDHQGVSDIDTLPVTLIVGDTIVPVEWDTISTGVISLMISNNGRFGGNGDASVKGVRMDYWNDPLECDTVDSIPGASQFYLKDGSFAVGGIRGADTLMSCEIYSQGLNKSTVFPLFGEGFWVSVVSNGRSYSRLVNSDSSLAFSVKWVAPTVTETWGTAPGKTWYADQNFITRELKIWSNNGLAFNGLAIGDVVDWDIPADSGADNTGDVDATRRLLYQAGGEYNQDNGIECQNNSDRYGGIAFAYLKAYWDHDNNSGTAKTWTIRDSIGYGGYIQSNYRDVYNGWKTERLYKNMESFGGGYASWTHSHPDSQQTDLHSVLTSAFDYDLKAGDTVVVYTVYASVRKDEYAGSGDRIKQLSTKGRNFTYYFTCCNGSIRGDLNGDGAEGNVLDLTFAVDRLFRGGIATTCPGEADVNGDKSPLDILDLTFLVDRIFRGGPAPRPCFVAPTK